jgi:hypothetical protein
MRIQPSDWQGRSNCAFGAEIEKQLQKNKMVKNQDSPAALTGDNTAQSIAEKTESKLKLHLLKCVDTFHTGTENAESRPKCSTQPLTGFWG